MILSSHKENFMAAIEPLGKTKTMEAYQNE